MYCLSLNKVILKKEVMVDEEMKEKKTNESEYNKMNQEKMHYYRHQYGPFGMIFGVLIFLLILGGVFALGRGSSRHYAYGSFGKIAGTEASYGGGGMMRGYGRHRVIDGDENTISGYRNRIAGQISTVNSDNIVIKDTDGTAYTVKIASDTSVVINGKIDKASNLKASSEVIVVGDSNSDGSINATIIRSLQ